MKAKKNLRTAIESVASRLGNTPTICRKCYIHPQILDCYLEGGLLLQVKEAVEGELTNGLDELRPEEAAVLSLLRGRLERAAEAAGADAGSRVKADAPRQTGGRKAKAAGTKRGAAKSRAA